MSDTQRLKLLITGGSGFIGSRLARLAVEAGHSVTVSAAVNNLAERSRCEELERAGMRVVLAALDDAVALAEALRGQEYVIHLAAAQHEAGKPEEHFHRVNVEGTRSLLQLASSAGVRRFIHGSTIGVYGSAASGTLDEQSPLAPDNPYGRTKAEAEAVVRAAATLPFSIVRISETYGPGDMRLLKLFRGIAKGRYLTIGSGSNLHQLIYVDDLARGLLAACTAPAAQGETIVLAGAERVSTDGMALAIAAALGRKGRIRHVPLWPFALAASLFEATFPRIGLQPPLHRRRLDFFRKSFTLSTAKAERLLGWRAAVSFVEGSRCTADWYRARGHL